jgi:hypothetical protein
VRTAGVVGNGGIAASVDGVEIVSVAVKSEFDLLVTRSSFFFFFLAALVDDVVDDVAVGSSPRTLPSSWYVSSEVDVRFAESSNDGSSAARDDIAVPIIGT